MRRDAVRPLRARAHLSAIDQHRHRTVASMPSRRMPGTTTTQSGSTRMRTTLMSRLETVGGLLRKAGPYVALELLMPGGTLLAIVLFVYQRRNEPVVARPFSAVRRFVDSALG